MARTLHAMRFVEPGETPAQRATRGVLWMFTFQLVDNCLQFVRAIVLARLLTPEDFGLMAMGVLVLTFLDSVSKTGFDEALIQKSQTPEIYLDAGWTVQVLRGIVVFISIWALAIPVSIVFNEPRVVPILAVLALGALIKGFDNISMVYLRKELEFPKLFVYLISGSMTYLIVGVVAGLVLRNIWALVLSNVAVAAVGFVVSYLIDRHRPCLSLEPKKVRELVRFGRWIWAGSILVFLLLHGDDLFVGKALGATALGLYQMAYTLSNLPATQITKTIQQVAFPAFSKVQDKGELVKRGYLSLVQGVAFVSVPLAGGIALFSMDFTRLLLGEQWMPMVPALQILSIWGMLRSIGMTNGSVFMAVGRPDLSTKLSFSKLILLAVAIWPLSAKWGITGTALAVLLQGLVVNPIGLYTVIRVTGLQAWSLIRVVLLPLINTLAMIGTLALLKAVLFISVGLAEMVFLAILGLMIYLALARVCDRFAGYGIQDLLESRLADLW